MPLAAMQVAVIAKTPEPGSVKTRLCPPCTPTEAARVAEAALIDTLAVLGSVDAVRRIVVLEGEPGPWLPDGFEVIAQAKGTFDHRLHEAFRACLATCPAPLIVVAMDTPQLTPAHLTAAATSLNDPSGPDAVLGPAADGGYWLIGMRHLHPAAFDNVPMSEANTLAAQEAQLRRCEYRVELVGQLVDFDNFAQALEVADAVPGSRFAQVVGEVQDAIAKRASSGSGRSRQRRLG